MTDLNRLTVSLTKHGAHKVGRLVTHLPLGDVLENCHNDQLNVNIDRAVTRTVLSADEHGTIPEIWQFAQNKGPETVNALTLVSIIFSHHELIQAFSSSTEYSHQGTIRRSQISNEKGFTNLSNNVHELGYGTAQSREYFSYDFSPLFQLTSLGSIVREILEIKLRVANWGGRNSLIDEAIQHDFHKVFGLEPEGFSEWLKTGGFEVESKNLEQIDDLEFLTTTPPNPAQRFEFKPGHTPRQEEGGMAGQHHSHYQYTRMHNAIQNSLYNKLTSEYGEQCVGTEQDTGLGTSIDLVVQTTDFCWFYEIKTAQTAKLCIRQAIPQLLEYAYWGQQNSSVDKMIIASPHQVDDESEAYLAYLRQTFGLQLYYEQHMPNHH